MDRLQHIFPKMIQCEPECESGWFEVVRDMCEELEPCFGVVVTEVREKFGVLRVTLGGVTDDWDYVNAIVSAAEAKSRRVCEKCAAPGITHVDLPWIKTLCDDCRGKLHE